MITIDAIKTEQTKLAEMIAAFEKQAAETTQIHFPEALIELAANEHYAGIVTGKDGEASYHLVLMAAKPTDDLNWQAAKDWAKRVGGDLPTRREQALLYANCKEQFEERYYWSGEQHASDARCAWLQDFSNGGQNDTRVSYECRARAVRRLPI
jgi:hypothetical protein